MKRSQSPLLIAAGSFLIVASVCAGACSSSASVGALGPDVFQGGITVGQHCSGAVYVTGATGFLYCSGGVWIYTDDKSDIPSTDTVYTGDDAGDDAGNNEDADNDDVGIDAGIIDAASPDAADSGTTADSGT